MVVNHKFDVGVIASKFGLSIVRMQRRIYRFKHILGSAEVEGKRVLEIGAGEGVFSCLLSLAGAESVISLEPELDGHSDGAFGRMVANIKRFGLANIFPINTTIQDYHATNHRFDIIVSEAAINHLDEKACMNLHKDPMAKSVYVALFRELNSLLDTHGMLVFADCARKNLFSGLAKYGIVNPIAFEIKWEKHQQPELWATLLKEAGFANVVWRWLFPAPLWLGTEKLLNNPVMAYFTTSYFVIQAEKRL